MKIFYLGKFGKMHDEEHIARSFEAIGHDVYRQEEDGYSAKFILERVQDYHPDFFLCAKMRIPEAYDLLLKLRGIGLLTVSWTFDLYFGYARENIVPDEAFFKCDVVFTTDGGHDEQFRAAGIRHFCLRQGIYKPEAFIANASLPVKQEIVFVGSSNANYPYRQQILAELITKYGPRMLWLGSNNTDEVRGTRLNTLFANIPIVFGDSVYSPHYWSNRIYETLGRGGFLIHPEIPGLDQEFEPGKHFVSYKIGDYKDLENKIDHYLTFPFEADRIKVAGFNYCKKNYNMEERCKTLIITLRSIGMSA